MVVSRRLVLGLSPSTTGTLGRSHVHTWDIDNGGTRLRQFLDLTPPQYYIDPEDQFYVYYDIYRTTYVIIIDTLIHSILYREHVPFNLLGCHKRYIGLVEGGHCCVQLAEK